MRDKQFAHTFVICAYQDSPYLEKCIHSLLSQSSVINQKSKVILYTSTPTELMLNIAEKYKLKHFIGKGGGIGADWNGALSFVDTKYATIAHQDDTYEPEYGTKIIQAFQKQEDLNIVFSDYYETDENDNIRKRNINLKVKTFGLHVLSLFKNKSYQRRVYSFGNFICCPAVSYNMERLSDFKFDEELRMALDWDAWERIMRRPGAIKYLSERLMAHRIHSESETSANTVDKNREKEEYDMFRRYWGKNMTQFLMKIYVNNQKGNS
ncbi:glycosyltransferase [Lactococcus garvieae]|uniref:glycosyltransferase n=1 Tax=Lactococcus garvieae TaxID=1363 RepID=UPI003852000A